MEMIFDTNNRVQTFLFDYNKDTNIERSITALLYGLINGVEETDEFMFEIVNYGLYQFCADEQLMTTYNNLAHNVSELKCPVLKFENLFNSKNIFKAGDMVQDWSHVDTDLESLFVNEENGYMTTHFYYEAPLANMYIKDIRVTGTYMPMAHKYESGEVCTAFSYKIRVDVKYN